MKDIAPETQQLYMFGPYQIKAQNGVAKMMETLVCCGDFLKLELPKEQGEAMMNQLRPAIYPYQQEVGDVQKSAFYQNRPTGAVKAHMMLYGHLCRQQIPSILMPDFYYVMQKTPRLIQELFTLSASVPRIKPGYGWAQPSISAVELMQCMVRAVPIEAKKHFPSPMKSRTGPATLVQLPHLTHKMVLEEHGQGEEGRRAWWSCSRWRTRIGPGRAGGVSGLSERSQALDVLKVVYQVPGAVHGGQDVPRRRGRRGARARRAGRSSRPTRIMVTVSVSAFLNRRVHNAPAFKEVHAARRRTPSPCRRCRAHLPAPQGRVLGVHGRATRRTGRCCVSRGCAWRRPRARGFKSRAKLAETMAGGSKPEALVQTRQLEEGQEIKLQFVSPQAVGEHQLTLVAMCDSWIGADYGLGLKIDCIEPLEEKKTKKKKTKSSETGEKDGAENGGLDRSEESEVQLEGSTTTATEEISPDSDEAEDEEDDEGLWDEDEYGTEESEGEDDEPKKTK